MTIFFSFLCDLPPSPQKKQKEFIIGVTGTSIAAGHENYFNQSFPVVWGALMKEAFARAGVGLTVRNHAIGNSPIYPSYFCVGEIVGEDVDLVLWEYSLMGGDDGDLEQWLRSALLLPKQPHLLLCDAGIRHRDGRNQTLEKCTDRTYYHLSFWIRRLREYEIFFFG